MRKTKLEEQSTRLHKLSRYYASSLVESGSLYGKPLLEAQVPVLEGTLKANKNLKELMPYLRTHWANQAEFLKTQKIDTAAWLNSCKAVTL
jgi:hypothetical protein